MSETRVEDTYISMTTNVESIQADNQLQKSLGEKCSNKAMKWTDFSNNGPLKLKSSKRTISENAHINGEKKKHYKGMHKRADTPLPLIATITSEFPSRNQKTKHHGEEKPPHTLYFDEASKRPHSNISIALRPITAGASAGMRYSRPSSKSDAGPKEIKKRMKTPRKFCQSEQLLRDINSTDNIDTLITRRRSKRSNASTSQTFRNSSKFHDNKTESTGFSLGEKRKSKISKSNIHIDKLVSDAKLEQSGASEDKKIDEIALSNVTVFRRTGRLRSRRHVLTSNEYKTFADTFSQNIVKSPGKIEKGSKKNKNVLTRLGVKISSKIQEVLENSGSVDPMPQNVETLGNVNKRETHLAQRVHGHTSGNIRNLLEPPNLIVQMRHCRQIKPTPKLLSNAKLRCNLESRNNTRLVDINTQFLEDIVKDNYPKDLFTTRTKNYAKFCGDSSSREINIDFKNCKEISEFTELSEKYNYLSVFGLKRNFIDDAKNYNEKGALIPLKKAKQHRNWCEPKINEFLTSFSSLRKMSLLKLEGRENLSNNQHTMLLPNEHTSLLNVVQESLQTNNLTKKLFIKCLCEGETTQHLVKRDAKTCCDALDHINGTLVGCLNEIRDQIFVKLFRPNYRIQYMTLCQDHIQRLRWHKCCSYCGIFCTQGKFMLCNSQHTFHSICARLFSRTHEYESPQTNLACPHCGCSEIFEIYMTSMKCRKVPVLAVGDNSLTAKIADSHIYDDQTVLGKSFIYFLNTQKTPQKNMEIVASHLLSVVSDHDVRTAMEIISTGYDVTSRLLEFNGGSVLHGVAHQGGSTMTRLILCTMPCSEFINAFDNDGKTPLMCSVVSETIETLQVLIEFGADINIRNAAGMTCLHFAVKYGNSAAVKYILKTYKNKYCGNALKNFISQKDISGYSALLWAENSKNSNVARMMVEYATKEINQHNGINNIHRSKICLSNQNMINLMPNENKKIVVRSKQIDTPLHILNRHSDNDVGILLVDNTNHITTHNINKQHSHDGVRLQKSAKQNYCNNMNCHSKPILVGKIILSDISRGKELFPVRITVQNLPSMNKSILLEFKYIVKSVYQDALPVDYSVNAVQICSCSGRCNTADCTCVSLIGKSWYEVNGRLAPDFDFEKPSDLFECNDSCGCNITRCQNRVVQKGMQIPLEVFHCESETKGFGVRSLIPIGKGTFVCEYAGEILTDNTADLRDDDSYLFELGTGFSIDAKFYGNISRFFNHSCQPNLSAVRVYFQHSDLRFPKIGFFASRNIPAFEELSFDYGDKFWAVKAKLLVTMKRSKEPSEEQKEILLDYMEMNLAFACDRLESADGAFLRRERWDDHAEKLNGMGGALKDAKKWRKYWTDQKHNN